MTKTRKPRIASYSGGFAIGEIDQGAMAAMYGAFNPVPVEIKDNEISYALKPDETLRLRIDKRTHNAPKAEKTESEHEVIFVVTPIEKIATHAGSVANHGKCLGVQAKG